MATFDAIRGLKKLPKPNGCFTWYWAASQLSRNAGGFRPKTERLWHGRGQPNTEEIATISRRADELTLEFEEWLYDPVRRPMSKTGTIYFVRAAESVKIGFTRNIERRFSQLRSALPVEPQLLFTMPGTPVGERALHRRFRASRFNGEWFRYEAAIAAFVEKNIVRTGCQNHPPVLSESQGCSEEQI